MKKYITIAALLAAGSACANADVDTITFASTGSALTQVTVTAESGAIANAVSLKKSNSATSTEYTQDLGVKNVANLTSVLAPDVNVANAGQWQFVFSYTAKSDFVFTGIDLATVGFDKNGTWQNNGNQTAPTGTTSSTTTPGNGATGKFVKFTVEYALGDLSETTTWTKIDDTYSIDVVGSTARETTFDLSKDVEISSGTQIYFQISTSQDYTGGTFAGIKSVSIIPEPSAFGLLAGIGALALVASRRRRK